MASTADRIRKEFDKRIKSRNGYMTAKKHEKQEGRANRMEGERGALMQDLVDYDRYNSSRLPEAIPYERQREMGVAKSRQPKGAPYVSKDEAWDRRVKNRRPRRK